MRNLSKSIYLSKGLNTSEDAEIIEEGNIVECSNTIDTGGLLGCQNKLQSKNSTFSSISLASVGITNPKGCGENVLMAGEYIADLGSYLDSYIENNMVLIPANTFTMGDIPGTGGRPDELPIHSVTLSSYYISKYECTQLLWVLVMGSHAPGFIGNNCPVRSISWNSIQTFLTTLNSLTTYTYRLLTEAEWECAARGGVSDQLYSGSNIIGDVAWYVGNSGGTIHTVGTKNSNQFGLYDMSGNVWEWCNDWYSATYYTVSPSTDPQGPTSGTKKIIRGGSIFNTTPDMRVSIRVPAMDPTDTYSGTGFRLARSIT